MVNQYCSLTEIENMMPWEREVYLSLINNYITKMNNQNQENKDGGF